MNALTRNDTGPQMLKEREIAGRRIGWVGLGTQLLGASKQLSIDEVVRIIHAALDAGTVLFDTADVYAPDRYWIGQGERLLGEALRLWPQARERAMVATKGGNILGSHPQDISRDGSPAHLKAACDASLRALGVDSIDLYQLHAIDSKTPLEDSIGALVELQKSGKVRHIGLSNTGRKQLNLVKELARIESVQSRYSVVARETRGVADWCAQEHIAFLAYSPLGRERASRLNQIEPLASIALRRGVSVQRAALAWLLHQGDHILPLPGATSVGQVEDNIAAAGLHLDSAELAALDALELI